MTDKLIVLCTGHFRDERGAKHKYLGVTEWQMCSIISEALLYHLEFLGYNVKFIGNDKLTTKVKKINDINPDVVLELHMNAYDTKRYGHLCLHWYNSRNGATFARIITDCLVHNYPRHNVHVSTRNEKGSYFLRKTKCPAVLIELCFIDNLEDLIKTMHGIKSVVAQIGMAIDQSFKHIEQFPV